MAKYDSMIKRDRVEMNHIKNSARPRPVHSRAQSREGSAFSKTRQSPILREASNERISVAPLSDGSHQNRAGSAASSFSKKGANDKKEANPAVGLTVKRTSLHLDLDRTSESGNSCVSHRSESRHAFRDKIDEKKVKRVLNAKKYVTGSSEHNQMIVVLLTEAMKKNRKLQHLDLTSTNLPSQVIIYLCERLRKSRSILSVHFTNNPGLYEPNLEQTVRQLLKCKD